MTIGVQLGVERGAATHFGRLPLPDLKDRGRSKLGNVHVVEGLLRSGTWTRQGTQRGVSVHSAVYLDCPFDGSQREPFGPLRLHVEVLSQQRHDAVLPDALELSALTYRLGHEVGPMA